MTRLPCSARNILSACLALGLLTLLAAPPATAQPTPPVESFDLVLYGANLAPQNHHVELKSNPWRGDAWIDVGDGSQPPCPKQSNLRVFPELSAQEYLGQDIRENYVALKITAKRAKTEGTLRAVYALPSAHSLDAEACRSLADLITSSPSAVRRHSIALHTRPRPASLSTETPFIEHLEAPIRHRKPGVMEVKWLEILFSSDG